MRLKLAWWTALPVLAAAPAASPALAQQVPAAPPAPAIAAQVPEIAFSADQVTYDSGADMVIASGDVRMSREGNYLAADQIVWDRGSGQVRASGNVVLLTPEGDKAIGDSVVLTDSLRDGTVTNLLLVLESGARLAAARATRAGTVTTLDNAVYSPCPVTSESGCPKRPSWAITAARVVSDPAQNRVRFEGGRFQLFGMTLPLLPIFSIGTSSGGASGWLVPDLSVSTRKGFEIAAPYHMQIGPNRDLTLTPHLYSGVLPALEGKYRELNSLGAFQLGGFLTYGKIERVNADETTGAGLSPQQPPIPVVRWVRRHS